MFAVALVLSAGMWITSSTVQTGVPAFPAAPTTCTIDAQGADDEAGQKDLSEFCRDDVNQDYVSWNLDNTQWSGQNTGDACALYDTNDLDSFANYAVCVQLTGGAVDEASMVVGSPLIYQCGNDRVDRCTNAVLLASGTTASTICEVNNGGTLPNKEDADPFDDVEEHQDNDCAGPGCETDDAITVCDIDVTDFGLTAGTTVTLLDVCSYPSGQPNSDPSDCIVTADVDPCAGVDCSSFNTDCSIASCEPTTGQCTVFTPKAAGTACGSASDSVCDNPDTCNASGVCQPNNEPAATVVCRADAGACDVAELCDGAGSCPTDTLEPVGTACGSPTDDVCDNPDTCNASGTCQPNNEPITTVCRAADGECDVAESCDGAGSCPTDSVKAGGDLCRADTGECDVPEYCDGTSKTCPIDGFEPPDTECGDDTDDTCTNPDSCDGSGQCLPNNEPCGFVTNSSLCTFDVDPNLTGRQFRVIYSPSMPAWPAYRLHGTNPGQYYYNAFVSGEAGKVKNVKLKIPWPFVTQGAQPVHVYDGDDVDVNDCIRVDGQLPIAGESYPATITLNDIVHGATKGGTNNAGHSFSVDCSASKNAPNGLPNGLEGYECIVSVDVLIPPSELAYVNIHLDYGVKGPKTNVNPWDEFADLYDAGPIGTNCGSYLDALQNNGEQDGLLALATCTNYVFAHEECIAAPGDPTCSDSVQNVNEFKKPKGAFGLANKSSDGSALGGLAVALVNAKGQVVSSGFTDEDGFFGLSYKHVGKAADFSLVLGYGSPPASTIVTLKANGFTEASYDATTKSWFLDSLPTKSK